MARWMRADVLCGLMFIGFAAWGFAASRALDPGTLATMGPGYFPRIVSGILLLLGMAIVIAGLWSGAAVGLGRWALRPITFVSLSGLLFSVLLQPAGIVLSIIAVVAVGACAGNRIEPGPLALLTLLLIVASVLLFVVAIGIPLPIWPRLGFLAGGL